MIPFVFRAMSLATLAMALALAAGASQAQVPSAGQAAPMPAPASAVAYLNGGIGRTEAESIETRADGYNLRLMFSEGRNNAFVSDVHLRIADQTGRTVLTLNDAGPLTDVKLPSGRYQVDSRFGHMQRHNNVELKEGQPTHLYLHFPHDSGVP